MLHWTKHKIKSTKIIKKDFKKGFRNIWTPFPLTQKNKKIIKKYFNKGFRNIWIPFSLTQKKYENNYKRIKKDSELFEHHFLKKIYIIKKRIRKYLNTISFKKIIKEILKKVTDIFQHHFH